MIQFLTQGHTGGKLQCWMRIITSASSSLRLLALIMNRLRTTPGTNTLHMLFFVAHNNFQSQSYHAHNIYMKKVHFKGEVTSSRSCNGNIAAPEFSLGYEMLYAFTHSASPLKTDFLCVALCLSQLTHFYQACDRAKFHFSLFSPRV